MVGERQAARMAHWLNRHLPGSARVLVCPSLRARQTAEHLGLKVRVCPALGAEATVDALLCTTRWPESREPVVVVGHQDTLGLTAAYLLAGAVEPWPLRKGAVWWLRYRPRESGGSAVVLHAALSPDLV